MNLELDIAKLEIAEKRKRRCSGTFKSLYRNMESEPMDSSSSSDSSESPSPSTSTAPIILRRSSRKRIHSDDSKNHPVKMKPKKSSADFKNLEDIKSYYLDKTVKKLPSSLETIYEEPQQSDSELGLMSARKFKRSLNFTDNGKVNKNSIKSKKRRLKVKKLGALKKGTKKITIDYVVKYLQELKDDGV